VNAVSLSRSSATTRVLAAGACCAGVAGIWLLRNFDPNSAHSPFPPCLFHAVTGLYCPGCGTTRALHALVHGNLPQAMAMNPLAVLLLAIAPFALGWRLGWRPAWLQVPIRWLSEPKLWLVLLPAYWIARNLPWWPFSWLAPG
jgi:hypothetical protein